MVAPLHNLQSVDPAIDARAERRRQSDCADIWDLLDSVKDPEIPVLSLWDLGVLRDVHRSGQSIDVVVTPTYSGCPALEVMRDDIVATLRAAGNASVDVLTELTPAWHSGWISEAGRRQLREYGIAPPVPDCAGCNVSTAVIVCPLCNSAETDCVSEFASTACKALYRCRQCGEPFDYFKAL